MTFAFKAGCTNRRSELREIGLISAGRRSMKTARDIQVSRTEVSEDALEVMNQLGGCVLLWSVM